MIIIRPIRTKKPFDSSVFRKEVIAEAHELGAFVKKDYEKTTKTWTHQPEFGVMVKATGKGVELTVSTDDKIYGYVDQGTKPHPIFPVNKLALAFPSSSRPKTKPRIIKSYKGFKSKKITVLFPGLGVYHPGTEAREFSKTIAEKWKPGFQRGIQNALDRAAKRSGHA